MRYHYFFILLLVFNTLNVFAQAPTALDTLDVKWEIFNTPKKGPNFSQYFQVGDFLFAQRGDSLFKSSDFGKTWVLKRLKVVIFFSSGKNLVVVEHKIDKLINKDTITELYGATNFFLSKDFGDTYINSDSIPYVSKSFNRESCYDGSTLSFFTLDSIVYRFFNAGCSINNVKSRIEFSSDGILWTKINGNDKPFFKVINNYFFSRSNNKWLYFGKNGNVSTPDSLNLYSENQDLIQMSFKDSVFSTYSSSNASTQIYSTKDKGRTWETSTLPFPINNQEHNKTVFQDDKFIYLLTREGIFRSDDAYFKRYKKIYPFRYNTYDQISGFSVLPSGIYMNGLNSELIRSTDKGETWQIINNTEGVVGFPTLITFKDSIWLQSETNVFINPLNFQEYRYYENPGNLLLKPIVKGLQIGNKTYLENFFTWDNITKTWEFEGYNTYKKDSNRIYAFSLIDNSIKISIDSGKSFKYWKLPISSIKDAGFINEKLWLYYDDGIGKKQLFISKTNEYDKAYEKLFPYDYCQINKILSDATSITVFTDCGIFENNNDGKTWVQFASNPPAHFSFVEKYKDYYIFSSEWNRDFGLITGDRGLTWKAFKKLPHKNFAIVGGYLYTIYNSNFDGYIYPEKRIHRTHIDSILKNIPTLKEYAILSGFISKDLNNNCKKDSLEDGIAGKIINILPSKYTLVTDKNGHFAVALPPSNYTLSTPNIRNYIACNDTIIQNIQIKLNQNLDTTFLFKPVLNINDLALTVTAETTPRIGFQTNFLVEVNNLGTVKVDSAVVTLRIPTATMAFVSAEQGGIFQSGVVTWNVKNMGVDEIRQLKARLRTLATTPLGSNLSFTGKVTVLGKNDTFPLNNEEVVILRAVSSFEPNEKTASPAGRIPYFTSELDYIIRFQNTGKDTAFKVVVVDTLSLNLAVSTLKPVSSSHPYTLKLDKNIASFTFNNILLVDSIKNERASHGFIRFKIGLISGLEIGDSILNRAAIYFDTSKPTITNIAKSNLIKPLLSLNRIVNICQGELYNGKLYKVKTFLLETVRGTVSDTLYSTTLEIRPTFLVLKDTIIKDNELFEGKVVAQGDTVLSKSLKTVLYGCDSTISYKIQKVSKTLDFPVDFSNLIIYPNPANDYLSISYEVKQATWVEILLYNAVGQKVKILQQKNQNIEGGYQVKTDVKNLNSGIYQIGFQTETGIFYWRFVKME
jgi:uncharacterized repeat protein (TIGR01451 family)